MSNRCKYILLEKFESETFEVPPGEILEELDSSEDIWNTEMPLFYTHRQVNLTCPTSTIARLTDLDATELMKIKSPKRRLDNFKSRKSFKKLPTRGTQVFVTVKGREFQGIVRYLKDSLFGVQLFNEVSLEEHCAQDGTFQSCKQDVLCRLPNGGIGVLVRVEKLRPRDDGKETPPLYNVKPSKRAIEMNNYQNLITRLEAALAEEKKSHEETMEDLRTTRMELNKSEKELTCQKQICKEMELKLNERKQLFYAQEAKEEAEKRDRSSEDEEEKATLEKQQHCNDSETSTETNESRRAMDYDQNAKEEVEKMLQNCKEKSKELQTMLTTTQNLLLEEKAKYRNEYAEWILKREEIQLTKKILGKGRYGIVYKGEFRGTQVAVKQLSDKPRITDYNIGNFRREMKMAAKCRHPCMLQFIGATSDDQSPLLVMELLDTSLNAVLLERALDPIEIKTIAKDVAKGLNYLHLNKPCAIVHRDISSRNVLLWKKGDSWRGKISDYGNAVLMNYAKTGSGGAVSYLAPEIDNQRFLPMSDVYSYGVLLLEMVLRREPSYLDNRDELIHQLEDGKLMEDGEDGKVRTLPPELKEFTPLLRRCTQRDPAQRPSMKEVLDLLTTKNE